MEIEIGNILRTKALQKKKRKYKDEYRKQRLKPQKLYTQKKRAESEEREQKMGNYFQNERDKNRKTKS